MQMSFKFFDDIKLHNVQINTRFLPLSLTNYLNGKYQFHLEKNFLQHSGLFGILSQLNNTLNYNVFDQASGLLDTTIVGKNHSLYDPVYVKDYNGIYPDYDSPVLKVKRLKFLQDYLEKVGIPFLLVIHPNKVLFHPEWIPESFETSKKEKRFIEDFEPILKKFGIHYVRVADHLKKGEMNFPKSGAHMGDISKCRSAKIVSESLNVRYPNLLPEIDCSETNKLTDPDGEDLDLPKTLNVFDYSKSIEKNRAVKMQILKPGIKPLYPMFLGTSYSFGLIDFLSEAKAFRDTDMVFYVNRIHKKRDILSKKPKDSVIPFKSSVHKKRFLLLHDMFILESTEARLPELGFGFIDRITKEINYKPIY